MNDAHRLAARWLVALASMLVAAAAYCQGGPPLITDDTETVPTGKWEINFAWTAELSAGRWQHEVPTFDFNRGVDDRTHVNFEVPWVFASENGVRNDGMGNAGFGAKWRFIEMSGSRPAVSIHPAIDLNLSRRSARAGLVDAGTSLLFPIDFQWDCDGLGVNAEVGTSHQPGAPPGWVCGLALGHEYGTFELLAEVHGDGVFATGENDWLAQFGLRHDFDPTSTLLFAFGRSIATNGPPVRWTSYVALQLHF